MELIYDLLSSAQKDIKKIPLMYKTNMSYVRFTKYLNPLVEKGFLCEKDSTPGGKVYCVSDKGKELLEPLHIVLTYLK